MKRTKYAGKQIKIHTNRQTDKQLKAHKLTNKQSYEPLNKKRAKTKGNLAGYGDNKDDSDGNGGRLCAVQSASMSGFLKRRLFLVLP